MELLLTLSKETCNTIEYMEKQPFEKVMLMFNTLKSIFEKEAKEREKQEGKQNGQVPSMSSLMHQASSSIKTPSIPRVHY